MTRNDVYMACKNSGRIKLRERNAKQNHTISSRTQRTRSRHVPRKKLNFQMRSRHLQSSMPQSNHQPQQFNCCSNCSCFIVPCGILDERSGNNIFVESAILGFSPDSHVSNYHIPDVGKLNWIQRVTIWLEFKDNADLKLFAHPYLKLFSGPSHHHFN